MFKVKDRPDTLPVHTVYDGATTLVMVGGLRLGTTRPDEPVAGIVANAVVVPEVVEVVYAIRPLSDV
jgi:hypothetical protein